jgi:uncharacterized protein
MTNNQMTRSVATETLDPTPVSGGIGRVLSQSLIPRFGVRQYVAYLLGCVGFSFGVVCFAWAGLGADPLYVFSTGLQKVLHFDSYAIAEGGFAAVMLVIWAIWNKKIPIISPFVTFVLCGRLIDFGKKHELASYMPYTKWPLMITAVVLCAYASSLIIMSGIGIRAMDLVAITMVQKFRKEFWVFKTLLEMLLLLSGWLMLSRPSVHWSPGVGIVMGIGTLFFVVFVDLLIQPFMAANTKYLRMKNHGLRGNPHAEA